MVIDETTVQKAVRAIITAIGEDPGREGLKETPARVAEMYQEIFGGMGVDPKQELTVGYELGHREMVVVRKITEHPHNSLSGILEVGRHWPDLVRDEEKGRP